MTALQTCDKMDNFDQKCCHMTLSVRKYDLKTHLIVSINYLIISEKLKDFLSTIIHKIFETNASFIVK